jgi:translation initiation factor IF-2
MVTADGKSVKQTPPGMAVELSGWKERPEAGDQVVQALKESDAKLCVRNRHSARLQQRDQDTIDTLNVQRTKAKKEMYTVREKTMVEEENKRSGKTLPGIKKETDGRIETKIVKFIVKADVSGSAEAVKEAIKHLGNEEVKVEVVDTSVGEITESDVAVAAAVDGSCPFLRGWRLMDSQNLGLQY